MQLNLPVKPYTLKFLTRHIGANYALRLDDPFGNNLYTLLLRNNRSTRTEDGRVNGYKCTFPVNVPLDKVSKKGARGFTALSIITFNNFAELIFKHEFHTFVETWTQEFNLTVADAIRRFYVRYNLTEEDIAEESLRRSYLRYEKRKKKQQSVEKTALLLSYQD